MKDRMCPHCASINIEYDDFDEAGGLIWENWHCDDCGEVWSRFYIYAWNEDDKGKIIEHPVYAGSDDIKQDIDYHVDEIFDALLDESLDNLDYIRERYEPALKGLLSQIVSDWNDYYYGDLYPRMNGGDVPNE